MVVIAACLPSFLSVVVFWLGFCLVLFPEAMAAL